MTTSPRACEHCGGELAPSHRCPIDTRNAMIWIGDKTVSDSHVHGLYQEDLEAGMKCSECERQSEYVNMSPIRKMKVTYAQIVQINHGVDISS